MSDHPNDQVTFQAYPDTGLRETYPPLPRRMGNPNAVATEGVIATVLSRLPTPLPPEPPPVMASIPSDPETDLYVAAGWIG